VEAVEEAQEIEVFLRIVFRRGLFELDPFGDAAVGRALPCGLDEPPNRPRRRERQSHANHDKTQRPQGVLRGEPMTMWVCVVGVARGKLVRLGVGVESESESESEPVATSVSSPVSGDTRSVSSSGVETAKTVTIGTFPRWLERCSALHIVVESAPSPID
jgi:hypothetical protein